MESPNRTMKLFGAERPRWLIMGVAGFIGSHLLQMLLSLEQEVTELDEMSTGSPFNLNSDKPCVTPPQWHNFRCINGNIRNLGRCNQALSDVTYVLHHAALGSVSRSQEGPGTNEANITIFLNMLMEARKAGVKRFVYAASSSTYGDHPGMPKVEEQIGQPLLPYAVRKLANELYANVFSRRYDLNSIGVRYFNIFSPRQDPSGAYAVVITRWIAGLAQGGTIYVNGDGSGAKAPLGYEPTHEVKTGIAEKVKCFMTRSRIAAMGVGTR